MFFFSFVVIYFVSDKVFIRRYVLFLLCLQGKEWVFGEGGREEINYL